MPLAWREAGGGWHEESVRVEDLREAVHSLVRPGERDVYIGWQRFGRWRRTSLLAELNAVSCDLDFYRVPDLADLHPWQVRGLVLIELEHLGLPMPNISLATGRGLSLAWLVDATVRQALPRWNCLQRTIQRTLAPLGADPLAVDCTRLVRLAGTRNGRTGHVVEFLADPGERLSFEYLAAEVLPFTREQWHALRKDRRGCRPDHRLAFSEHSALRPAQLWADRYEDLLALLDLRCLLQPGERDAWVFPAVCAQAWLRPADQLEKEAATLARMVAGCPWSDRHTRGHVCTAIRRAMEAARGETVEWCGRPVDPRYRYTNERLINDLGITPDEERHMRTIVSRAESRRRDAEWHRRARAAAGMVPRERHRLLLPHRAEAARILHERGLPLRAIGSELGVSHETVRRLLQAQPLALPSTLPEHAPTLATPSYVTTEM